MPLQRKICPMCSSRGCTYSLTDPELLVASQITQGASNHRKALAQFLRIEARNSHKTSPYLHPCAALPSPLTVKLKPLAGHHT